MQASFNSSQSFYSTNQPHMPSQGGAFQPPPAFAQQNSMQHSQQSFSRNFGGNGMSSYSSSCFTQQSSRGPGGSSNSAAWSSSSSFGRQGWDGGFDNRSMCYRDQSGHSSNNNFQQGNQWSDSGVSGNKSSINLGDYTLNFDKSNSSMLLTNTQTGNQTKIWGDPHIDLNSGSANQSSGMFNGPMTFDLPDHTKVTVGTQQAKNGSNVSYADNVTITQGNRAYVVNGLSEQDGAPLTVQRSNNGFALAQQAPHGSMDLIANRSGTGWINGNTGAPVKDSDFS